MFLKHIFVTFVLSFKKDIYIYMGALLLLGTPPAGLTKVSGLTQRANKHVNDEIGVHGLVQAVP